MGVGVGGSVFNKNNKKPKQPKLKVRTSIVLCTDRTVSWQEEMGGGRGFHRGDTSSESLKI